jgi:hypothetical protein
MSEKHVCAQRYALQLKSVPNRNMILTTVYWLAQNGTSNLWDSKY